MAIDTSVPRSRRALLAGGIGGLAALAGAALGRPLPVRAGTDGDVILGKVNQATLPTEVDNTGYGYGFVGTGGLAGLRGWSEQGHGVVGENYSPKAAILGHSRKEATGVIGYSGPHFGAAPAGPAQTGIYGAGDAAGVWGVSGAGQGVHGSSDTGDGVRGSSGGSAKSGVYGFSSVEDGFGVFGRNTTTGATGSLGSRYHGVCGESDSGIGVMGDSTYGVAVAGTSSYNHGLYGASDHGSGALALSGATDRPAVAGCSLSNGTGVFGLSSSGPLGSPATAPAKIGVYGRATQDAASRGVYGYSTSGRGVFGQATSGIGLYGQATTGFALRAVGRVKLDKCAGVTTIAAGARSKVVTPGIDLVTTSAVVATLQGDAGAGATVERVSVNTTTDSFTVHLTKAAAANVKVAWIALG